MLLDKLGLLAALTLSPMLAACGADCVSMCEKAQEDGDCFQQVDGDDSDCEDLCEDIEELAEEDNGDCEEELDELVSCMDDEDDACDALERSCTDELDDLSACIGDYCAEHPSNDTCVDVVLD
jgi:hypothetical protein